MKSQHIDRHWIILAFAAILGVLPVRAQSDIEKLTKSLSNKGISGVATLVETGSLQIPHVGSGDNPESDQDALTFGRELLRRINAITKSSGSNQIDIITSLLAVGQWIEGEDAYGNLIISHRAFDVAGALTLKNLCSETVPSEKFVILARQAAETTIEPSYRARVLDAELGTRLFSEQLAAPETGDSEQEIRKLWKNLCFLGYSEANPEITRDLDQVKQVVLQRLGKQSNAIMSLGKTVPQGLLVPQTLQYTSTELLETRNLWFVSMASAPGNLRDVASVLEYLNVAKQLPRTTVNASKEAVEQAFSNLWSSFDLGENLTIANHVGNVAYRVRSGAPLDRDSIIAPPETP